MANLQQFLGGASGSVAPTGQSSQSTYFGENQIADPLAGLSKQATNAYMPFVQNPTQHPLFQAQLGPLLQSLVPSEDRARQSLTDTFRASGGLRSGAYGREATMLEGELMGRRNQAAGQLLGQSFGQIVGALNNPIAQIPNLLQALKLSQGFGANPGFGQASFGASGGQSFLDQPFSDPYAAFGMTRPAFGPGGSYPGAGQVAQPAQAPSSGVTYGDLLGALGGGTLANGLNYAGLGGQTPQPFQPTPLVYRYPSEDVGLMGYQQGYDANGNPV